MEAAAQLSEGGVTRGTQPAQTAHPHLPHPHPHSELRSHLDLGEAATTRRWKRENGATVQSAACSRGSRWLQMKQRAQTRSTCTACTFLPASIPTPDCPGYPARREMLLHHCLWLIGLKAVQSDYQLICFNNNLCLILLQSDRTEAPEKRRLTPEPR